MGTEYKAKVFKSGNSLALRLPKALGLAAGDEMVLREEDGHLTIAPAPTQPRKIDLTGIAVALPWLKPLTDEDRGTEPRELDWEGKRLPRG